MLLSIFKWLLLILVGIGVAVWAFLRFAPVWGGEPDAASLAKIHASKNYDGTKFVNLEPTVLFTSEERPSAIATAWKMLNPPQGKNPSEPLPSVKLDQSALREGSVAWFGHSSVLFQTGGKVFLTDPVFHSVSPVPFTGKPFPMQHQPQVADLPHIDVLLLSHDHYDHLDYATLSELKDKVSQFIVPLGVKAHLQRWGVPSDRIAELDWDEATRVGEVQITLVPSRHFSGRRLNQNAPTLWGGYVVKSPALSLYFSGDSGYGTHFAQRIAPYGPFDFVMMENGAYDPAWAQIHQAPEQTAQALQDVQAHKAMPIHWAKFDLANHPWKAPIERLQRAISPDIPLITPKIGEVFNLNDEELPQEKWWEAVK